MLRLETFWNIVQQSFVSVDLIPASQILTLCQCLGLNGEKTPCYSIIVYYLVDFTFTLVSTKMFDHLQFIEYVNQVRCNLENGKKCFNYYEKTKRISTEVAQNNPVINNSLISPLYFCLNRQFNLMIFRFSFSFE